MPGRKYYILLQFILLFVILFAPAPLANDALIMKTYPPNPDFPARPEVTVTMRLIQPGTACETALYIIASPEEGPTVMVIGGVHGDEIAGYLAADIVATWAIDRGTLLVLPRANVPAIDTNTRFASGYLDLNASFPGSLANPTERLALAIYQVMEEYKPHWVVDLHEAWEFERVQKYLLGQTIIYPQEAPALHIVEQIVQGLNQNIAEELHQYQVVRGGVKGGTIRASQSLGLESFTIETTRKLPLEERIDQHLEAVRLLLAILEITVYESDSP